MDVKKKKEIDGNVGWKLASTLRGGVEKKGKDKDRKRQRGKARSLKTVKGKSGG